jgi:hypothetical protein
MIFLSHGSPDKPWVRFFAGELQACGLSYWLDEKQLLPGDSLQPTIERAIAGASAMVAFMSESSIESRWVKLEIDAVRRLPESAAVRFVPCLIGDIELSCVPADITALLCADMRNPDSYSMQMEKLLKKVGSARPARALPRLTAHRSADLARRAVDNASVRDWVSRWLQAFVAKAVDESERYWAYVTLGRLASPGILLVLANAADAERGFARQGALDALRILHQATGHAGEEAALLDAQAGRKV